MILKFIDGYFLSIDMLVCFSILFHYYNVLQWLIFSVQLHFDPYNKLKSVKIFYFIIYNYMYIYICCILIFRLGILHLHLFEIGLRLSFLVQWYAGVIKLIRIFIFIFSLEKIGLYLAWPVKPLEPKDFFVVMFLTMESIYFSFFLLKTFLLLCYFFPWISILLNV